MGAPADALHTARERVARALRAQPHVLPHPGAGRDLDAWLAAEARRARSRPGGPAPARVRMAPDDRSPVAA
ncbi:MAG: hypothetical protein MUE51_06050 [Thermoleophilia bacterium]|jgi:hypothetical protein|nr:hypothetical protein [Thermoleophilia bacterium]